MSICRIDGTNDIVNHNLNNERLSFTGSLGEHTYIIMLFPCRNVLGAGGGGRGEGGGVTYL